MCNSGRYSRPVQLFVSFLYFKKKICVLYPRSDGYNPCLIEFGIFELITALILNHINQHILRIFLLSSKIPQIFNGIYCLPASFFESFYNLSMKFRLREMTARRIIQYHTPHRKWLHVFHGVWCIVDITTIFSGYFSLISIKRWQDQKYFSVFFWTIYPLIFSIVFWTSSNYIFPGTDFVFL